MKHVVRHVAHWALLVHIYLSMAGFTLAILFAATGLTLNHQDFGWSEPRTVSSTMKIDTELLRRPEQTTIEQRLRETLGLRSPMTDYHQDSEQIQVTFAAPGHRTVVTIDPADGKANVETETRGALGRLGDLHKGFDSGKVWYGMIDLAALLLILSSMTGMLTLFALRAKRRKGFIVGGLGVLTIVMIYVIWVPR